MTEEIVDVAQTLAQIKQALRSSQPQHTPSDPWSALPGPSPVELAQELTQLVTLPRPVPTIADVPRWGRLARWRVIGPVLAYIRWGYRFVVNRWGRFNVKVAAYARQLAYAAEVMEHVLVEQDQRLTTGLRELRQDLTGMEQQSRQAMLAAEQQSRQAMLAVEQQSRQTMLVAQQESGQEVADIAQVVSETNFRQVQLEAKLAGLSERLERVEHDYSQLLLRLETQTAEPSRETTFNAE